MVLSLAVHLLFFVEQKLWQVLFKQVTAALPRYRKLRTLRLRRKAIELAPSPNELIAFPTSSPPSPSSPDTRFDTAIPVRTQERTQLSVWSKHCPTLSEVVFPSQGRWGISEGLGASVYSFIGVDKHA